MKITDGQKSFLFALAGIAVLILSYYFIANPMTEERKSIESEIVVLQARYDELVAKEARRDEYEKGIKTYEQKFASILEKFPTSLKQEITIMFLQGIKDEYEMKIAQVSLGEKEHFYSLGSRGTEGMLATPEEAADDSIEGDEADGEAVGLTEGIDYGSGYQCYRALFPISYSGGYDGIKDVLSYVQNFEHRMTVNTLNIAYDADKDVYQGNFELMCYDIEGDDRPGEDMQLNNIEIGIDNIFKGGGTGNATTLNKYDENNGATIERSYDFYAMLNPSASDLSAKVIGQNGKDASIISDSSNNVSTLSYDFYEKDGKNYVKYTLDNQSYEAEITSAEDVKLLLQSSARKDENDKSGIRVTIRNTTTLPIYVKVSGDDTTSPRVNIVSRTGAVRVY